MSGKLEISRPAREDLDEIWFFIAQDNLSAADRFVDFLMDRFPLLAASPRMGRKRDELAPGLRSFPVKSYVILYRLVGNGVEIVRVVHGARDLQRVVDET
jgi:toxin ParE1/3/4